MYPDNHNKISFWHYVKFRRKNFSGISTLTRFDDATAFKPSEKTEILNEYFKSVSQLKISIPYKETSPYPSIPEINITLQVVTNVLYNCNPYKLPSPDHLNATFLKHTSTEIAPMRTHLFQQSLRDNSIPVKWKQAYVTPIFKKGNRSEPKNYHPVSLISFLCKTLKQILVNQIMKHLESNDIVIEIY